MNRAPRSPKWDVSAASPRIFSALLLAATVIVAPGLGAADSLSNPPFDELTMSRSGCYGSCPIYTVTVSGDGQVRWHGENFVEVMGEATARLSELQLQALRVELDRADLPSLRDAYASPADGCPEFWTDAPGVVLSLRRGTVVKTIHHYLGCMDREGHSVHPAALATFEARIDEIVRSQQWIGHPRPGPPPAK